jgi:hypothetical protein
MLVYGLTKLCTELFLHYSLFVAWMLPNSRKASFCASKFTIYLIANTTDSHMLWFLLINLWFVAFAFSIQTRLTERCSLHARTAQYPVQNYSSAKCEEEFTEMLPPGKVPRPNSPERNSCYEAQDIPAFYGIRKFTTVFTTAGQWSHPEPDESSPHPPYSNTICGLNN